MGKTPIEWTDFSINPIRARLGDAVGHYCEKVSPGCKNCYASRLQPRFRMPPFQEQRHEGVEPFLDASKLAEVLRRQKPTRWFWCDMSDLFGEWVPFEWIAACFGVMAASPDHTFQVLTKRPARMREWFAWAREISCDDCNLLVRHHGSTHARVGLMPEPGSGHMPWPLPNVWLGVSCEDQQRADERIPLLLQCPAAVRFVSAEPLLGPQDLSEWLHGVCLDHDTCMGGPGIHACRGHPGGWEPTGIDWVIVGGESGPGARPCNVEWIRSIVHQCQNAGVPCFVKQLGAHYVDAPNGIGGHQARAPEGLGIKIRNLKDRKGGDMNEWPADLRVRQFPEVRNG